MCLWEKGAYYTRVVNFLKNTYWNVIVVPATVAMLREWRNGQEQSSWASVSSTAIKLQCHPHQPWHTHNSTYPHLPLGLHQSYTHHSHTPPTVRSCSPAGCRYVGPPTATSNLLRNIQTDASLTSLCGPPMQRTLTQEWVEEYAHRSHSPVTGRILAEAGAYCTRELVFSP